MATETFTIYNRWSGAAQFACDLETVAGETAGRTLGCAVLEALKSGADLSGANLSGADLRDANLSGADLRDADLSGADLRDAKNIPGWVPRIPDIHRAIYAAASKPGALDMGGWHNACGTSHCRAGWVVTLAGDAGRVMEGCYGTPAAAALIYQASDPSLERIPDFYCGDDEALADMGRLAGVEAQS